MELDFWKIALRPGKPLMFGRLDGMQILGLPGNPVSSLICAHIFLTPLIRAMLVYRTTRNYGLPFWEATWEPMTCDRITFAPAL